MYELVKYSAASLAFLCVPTALAEPHAAEGSASAVTNATPGATRVFSYAAASGAVESLFLREDLKAGGVRLTGLTHLAEGTRVWEEARYDHAGRLVRAESVCALPSGESTSVTFEPGAGVVETRSALGFRRWSVPTDYAWVWVPSGCGENAASAAITTPVAALVAARASKHQSVLRVIDPQRRSGHTVKVDQVVVREDAHSHWVVLGDDAVLVAEDVPLRWHANALDIDVEQR